MTAGRRMAADFLSAKAGIPRAPVSNAFAAGLRLLVLGGLCLLNQTAFAPPLPGVSHFVVIGCDGMSPDGVLKAKSSVMRRLMKEGAWSLHARGVMPTSSSPNWASMIMGAGPEQHGVTSNDWQRTPHYLSCLEDVAPNGRVANQLHSIFRMRNSRMRYAT